MKKEIAKLNGILRKNEELIEHYRRDVHNIQREISKYEVQTKQILNLHSVERK
jgi:hypothetical protein